MIVKQVAKLKRWWLCAALVAVFPVSAEEIDVSAKYGKSCAFCHGSGAAGAPKTFDEAAWAPRLAKGEAVLLASVVNGYNAMPPKGLCNDCTDAEFKALIKYMSKKPE